MRLIIAFTIVFFTATVIADPIVVPSDRVKTGVKIRESASTSSLEKGKLVPGESAEFIGEVPRWYRIDHPTFGTGFVSKSWTKLIIDSQESIQDEYEFYAVDVGTGLAIFVRGPDFTLVYDAGSRDDPKSRFLDFLDVVAPNLTRIDRVIVSHAHQDHIKMLPSLLERMEVGEVWDSGIGYPSCGYNNFLIAVKEENAIYHTAVKSSGTHEIDFLKTDCSTTGEKITLNFGSRLETGTVALGKNASMDFLHVSALQVNNINDSSLVVMLNLGDTKILLTGDIEAGEREIPSTPPLVGSAEDSLLQCCRDSLVADILVVAHHGSMTSSRIAFLEAVSAKDFIISSGPHEYGINDIVLPDKIVEDTITAIDDARLFKTYKNDESCKMNPNKIGTDNDGRPGGCNTIKVHIKADSTREISVFPNPSN